MDKNSISITVNKPGSSEQIACVERSIYGNPITTEDLEYAIYNKIFSIVNPDPKFPGDYTSVRPDMIEDYCKKSFTIDIINNNSYLTGQCLEHTIIVNDPQDTKSNVKIIYNTDKRNNAVPHCYADTMLALNPLMSALNIACLLVNDKRQAMNSVREISKMKECCTGVYICPNKHKPSAPWENVYDLSYGDILMTMIDDTRVLRFETGDADIDEWTKETRSYVHNNNIPDMIKAGIIKLVPLGIDSILLRVIDGFVAAKAAYESIKHILFTSENDMSSESRNAICNICDSINMDSFYTARDALKETMNKSFDMLSDVTEKTIAFINAADEERDDD